VETSDVSSRSDIPFAEREMVAGRQRLAVRFRSTPARREVASAAAARVAGVASSSVAVSGSAAAGSSGSRSAAVGSAWPPDLLPALPGSSSPVRRSPQVAVPLMGSPIPSQGSRTALSPALASSEALQSASASGAADPSEPGDIAFQPAVADPPSPSLFRWVRGWFSR